MICVACSGGGGGSSTPQPQPVPPPNNGPTIVLASIPSALDERQSFALNASQSNDADSDPLTYQVEFAPSDLARLTDGSAAPNWIVETPEVNQDEVVTMTVTVSDGQTSVSESLDFTIVNYARNPLSSKWGTRAIVTQTQTPPIARLGGAILFRSIVTCTH